MSLGQLADKGEPESLSSALGHRPAVAPGTAEDKGLILWRDAWPEIAHPEPDPAVRPSRGDEDRGASGRQPDGVGNEVGETAPEGLSVGPDDEAGPGRNLDCDPLPRG